MNRSDMLARRRQNPNPTRTRAENIPYGPPSSRLAHPHPAPNSHPATASHPCPTRPPARCTGIHNFFSESSIKHLLVRRKANPVRSRQISTSSRSFARSGAVSWASLLRSRNPIDAAKRQLLSSDPYRLRLEAIRRIRTYSATRPIEYARIVLTVQPLPDTCRLRIATCAFCVQRLHPPQSRCAWPATVNRPFESTVIPSEPLTALERLGTLCTQRRRMQKHARLHAGAPLIMLFPGISAKSRVPECVHTDPPSICRTPSRRAQPPRPEPPTDPKPDPASQPSEQTCRHRCKTEKTSTATCKESSRQNCIPGKVGGVSRMVSRSGLQSTRTASSEKMRLSS